MLVNNRFTVEKELGRGGFGVVYLAHDAQRNNALVVVKVLIEQKDPHKRAWIEQHFRKEAVALDRIEHPGVVKLVDSGHTDQGEPFFAMEFIRGRDLRSQIHPSSGLFGGFDRIARLVKALGSALSAAHDVGVYHRDLKPENIMLADPEEPGGDEQVKVIDFGIATVKNSLDEATKSTRAAGSLEYMAPEQFMGKASAAADIYALGVIAYEMLTGRVPFVADLEGYAAASIQLLDLQRGGVPVKPKALRPSLPEQAQDVVLKALSYQSADRYRRADEFGDALALALATWTGEASPSTWESQRTLSLPEQHTTRTEELVQSTSGQKTWTPTTQLEEPAPPTTGRPDRSFLPHLASIGLGVLLLAGAAGVALWYMAGGTRPGPLPAPGNTAGAPATARERTLSYWASLQQYEGKKPVGEPIKLTGGVAGETYFSSGDGLRFFLTPSDDGHLYMVNEEQLAGGGRSSLYLVFPSPAANGNASNVRAGTEVSTSELLFDDRAASETVWVVWSAAPVPLLGDAIGQWSNQAHKGAVRDEAQARALRAFFEEQAKELPKMEPDPVAKVLRVRKAADTLVFPLKLVHRSR